MLQATRRTLLPNQRSIRTTDSDHARDHLSQLLWPHRLKLRKTIGDFNFEHNIANCGSVSLNALRYGSEIEISATPSDFIYLIKFTLAGSCEVTQNNTEIVSKANAVCVMNPVHPVRVRLSHDHNQITLRVDGNRLHRFLYTSLGYQPNSTLEFSPVATSWQRNAPGLGRLVSIICEDFGGPEIGFIGQNVAPHLEDALYGLMLSELPHNFSERLKVSDCADTRSLKRACEFVVAHRRDEVRLEDIARAAGTSARNLQRSFRDYLKTTPMAYLRDHRLELARRELLEHPEQSVTNVALANGFTHAGRFIQYYRAKYGETPNATRKATPEK